MADDLLFNLIDNEYFECLHDVLLEVYHLLTLEAKEDLLEIEYFYTDVCNNTIELIISDQRVDPCPKECHTLRHAIKNNRLDIIKMFARDTRFKPHSCAMLCAVYGNIDVLEWLWSEGLDLNKGYDLFKLSISWHQYHIVDFLLFDAKCSLKREIYNDAVVTAVAYGKYDLIKLFLEVDPTQNINSALFYAATDGCSEIVKLLLGHGASKDVLFVHKKAKCKEIGKQWEWSIDNLKYYPAELQSKLVNIKSKSKTKKIINNYFNK